MIQIILSHAPSTRFRYTAAVANLANNCDVALLDPQSPEGRTLCAQLQARNPRLVVVHLTDTPESTPGRYRIPRKSLWSQLVFTLDDVVHVEFLHMAQRALQSVAPTQSPAPAPAVAARAPEPGPFKPGAAPHPLSKLGPLRALILDDSVTVRNQLEAALSKVGIRADLASNADSAFLLLEKHQFDLMFLDVVMPGIDGYDVCRQLRRNPATKHLPIVMLTSRSSPFDRARGALAGCDLYLVKPIDLKTFYQAVNKVVMKLFKNDTVAAQARGYVIAA
ncbi:response regulator [Tahibacter amnicola]|uniref:Response regulator n=1 Tax=Tahibacter amnicola TaxID=2976241 RepID=A0ABY6BL79_9GAMM|nr:response regulator [Tahibacter amnicola]UXI69145.1 response regulator [Tahibacter amnicola]